MIQLTPREKPATPLLITIVALLATLITGAIIFTLLGYDPIKALYYIFVAPFERADRIAELMIKACPLIIISLGLIFCFRANVWNIGAEGQFIIGALAAGCLALTFPQSTSPLLLPSMVIAAMLAGAAWAAIAALTRALFNANEILTTLMLSYVAALLLDYAVRVPLRDPLFFGYPLSKYYSEAGLIHLMPIPFYGTIGQLHYGVLIALILIPVAWWIAERTLTGFQIQVMGSAPRAGKFAGFSNHKTLFFVLLTSGALAGLAGMIEVSANIGQLQPSISFGIGFTAIIVAILARLNPSAVLLAGLVIAMTEVGGDVAQIAVGIPKAVTGLFKGILLFYLLAGATLEKYHLTWRRVA